MNNYIEEVRKRSQNLLIVEGKHEKDELFKLLFRCFPEMKISMHDIWIYGTNIYMLYEDIVKEYGEQWEKDDIDLPFVISKKQGRVPLRYKEILQISFWYLTMKGKIQIFQKIRLSVCKIILWTLQIRENCILIIR